MKFYLAEIIYDYSLIQSITKASSSRVEYWRMNTLFTTGAGERGKDQTLEQGHFMLKTKKKTF